MSKRTSFDVRTLYRRTGLESNVQVVTTKLTDNVSLTVPGLGVHDQESLAAILGWKAEDKRTGVGNRAYEDARQQLENTDQQVRLKEILYPKPVMPVGVLFEEGGEEFWAVDTLKETQAETKRKRRTKRIKPETGTTIYKLTTKRVYF